MAELAKVSIRDYLEQLDKKNGLRLTEKEILNAVRTLEDQWFSNAAELASLDAEAFKFLDLPLRLSNAILKAFGHVVDEPTPPPMPSPPPKARAMSPVPPPSSKSPPLEEKFSAMSIASPSVPSVAPKSNLEDVIKQVVEKAGDNEVVMQGLSNLLKKGIEDGQGGVVKQSVLRGYLKTLRHNTMARSSVVLGDEAKDEEPNDEKEPVSPAAERSPSVYESEWGGMTCSLCHSMKDKPKKLDCSHMFCTSCIHSHIVSLVDKRDAVGMKCPAEVNGAQCTCEISVSIIQSLLTVDEFNSYLEATLLAFIEQDSLTFKCPNEKCGALIAFQPNKPQEVPNPMLEKDDDGNPLTAQAWIHFQEFRARCRACSSVFCAQCKRIPYHKGFTCQTFQEFQKARHCRFCHSKIDASNSAPSPGPDHPGLRDVCNQQECLDKRALCCGRIKECGCPCNGVRDEKLEDCLPCLKHDNDVGEEFCSICYVEALQDAPCVQLTGACSHIFHYQCVVNKLKAGQPGARVSFEFKNCPLCQKPMHHPSLTSILKPIEELEEGIRKKSHERLIYEGREKDPAIVNASGRFYNNPVGFAMHQFLFYMCFQCKKPYFAGGYQCQEANSPFNPEELVCPGCQPRSVDDCPVHGTDWLAFKCRYCCSFANWYCWGKSHFCDSCHKSGTWQKLCEFRTGKNKKKLWEYPQCAGIQKAMAPIVADKSLSDTEKETKMEAIVCDPVSCPLHLPHPPNGIEYGLGCSMCEDKKTEKLNEEASIKAKQEAEQKRQALDQVKRTLKQYPSGLAFNHASDFDENGVFYYLGSCGKTQKWSNPADSGYLIVSSSGIMADSTPLSTVVGRELVRCVTKPVRNAWILFDLTDMYLELSAYTLKHYSSWDTECLRNWVLEGSNDGVNWDTIKQHNNDQGLNKKGGTFTWTIDAQGRRYRMFRMLQTGVNSNNHFYLAISGCEMYGSLYDSLAVQQEEEKVNDQDKLNTKTFHHSYDFDMNGILYYLGTNQGANKQWVNPAITGAVIASASSLAEKPPSLPASAICGRELGRCVSMAKPLQSFQVDFKDKKVCVTDYTIKHYNSWDTEALRNWRFEASNDGINWTLLKEHLNDQALNAKGATFTWKIDNPAQKGFFSLFRIFQTGRNSNNHYYLACSGLEFYGVLSEAPPPMIPPEGLELKYSYDFDANGLFYWIGTRGKKQPWRNPAASGLVVCSSTQLASNPPSAPVSSIVGRELVRCVTAAYPNMSFTVDLKDKRLRPSHYTLRHYNSWDTEALRNWVLEGSNDGVKWAVIKEHINDAGLDKKGITFTWPISCSQSFSQFRLRQTGLNSNNHHYLACSGMELYGRLFDAAHAEEVHQNMVANVDHKEVKFVFQDGFDFKFEHDMDENGLFFWIGSGMKTRPYENPGRSGLVRVNSSPLASQSVPCWASCGREVVRCVTEPKKSTFFEFDFSHLNMFLIPSAYSLRHYDSWDTEALRQWKLEGSIDGKKWKTLMSHKKDASLDHKGATHTWAIKGVTKSYNMFRVTQTGKNSNNHWYLCLSGFEIYGTLYNFRKK